LLTLARCARSEGSAGAFADEGFTYRVLSVGDRATVAALAVPMLGSAIPPESAARERAIVAVVRGVDVAVAGLPPSVQEEIAQLFSLLQFPVTRALAAGVWTSWERAGDAAVTAFLTRWRFSGIALFRSGYQALHQLVSASWYGNGASWSRIGYPGPPAV
jgi:hypothetical protein